MEAVGVAKVGERYKARVYRTKQLEFSDEVRILDDDLFMCVPSERLLNRWILTNRIIPVISLPIRYSPERRRYEFLKTPIFTSAGALRTAVTGGGLEDYDVEEATVGINVQEIVTWDTPMVKVEVKSLDYPAYVSIQKTDKSWGEEIHIGGEETRVFEISCIGVRARRAGGSDATIRVVGFR